MWTLYEFMKTKSSFLVAPLRLKPIYHYLFVWSALFIKESTVRFGPEDKYVSSNAGMGWTNEFGEFFQDAKIWNNLTSWYLFLFSHQN